MALSPLQCGLGVGPWVQAISRMAGQRRPDGAEWRLRGRRCRMALIPGPLMTCAPGGHPASDADRTLAFDLVPTTSGRRARARLGRRRGCMGHTRWTGSPDREARWMERSDYRSILRPGPATIEQRIHLQQLPFAVEKHEVQCPAGRLTDPPAVRSATPRHPAALGSTVPPYAPRSRRAWRRSSGRTR